MSFRTRLLLVSLTTLAVGLGTLLVVGNVVLATRVRAETSSLLKARADAQLAAIDGQERPRGRPRERQRRRCSTASRGCSRTGRCSSGPPLSLRRSTGPPSRSARRGGRREIDGPDDVRLRSQPVFAPGTHTRVGAVVVGLAVEPFEALQNEVLIGSLVVAALVLLAGWLTIRSALQGALHPVASMTASAEDWSAHDLDRSFDLGPATDELTGLAATLDGLLERIAASRRHEQRFAAEMAHELRTPVAGLRARAELALSAEGPEADAERVDALRAVIAQAERLDATIATLLAVARQELDPTNGAVDVAALANELDEVEVTAPPDLPGAEGEPEIVRRALAPLVDNARRHARSRVWLELSAGHGHVRVAVHDDGPGVDPDLGDRVFEPGVGGGGAGLGLPLARRLARSCGGDVVAGEGPGGCFVLELPAVVR